MSRVAGETTSLPSFSKDRDDLAVFHVGSRQFKSKLLENGFTTSDEALNVQLRSKKGSLLWDVMASAFGEGSVRKHHTWTVTLMLLTTQIGCGIFNQPQVFAKAGIAGATLLYVIAAGTILLGSFLLIDGAEARGLKEDELDWAQVAFLSLGVRGRQAADACIVVITYGACLSYLLLVGSLGSDLLKSWSGNDTSIWVQMYSVLPVASAVVILPICLIRHLSNMHLLAGMGMTAVTVLVIIILAIAPAQGIAARQADSGGLVWFSSLQCCIQFGSVVFALGCATAAYHLYVSLQPRTPKAWRKVCYSAMAMAILLCYTTGLVGYLSFRSYTDGDILYNLTGVVAQVAKALLVVHLVVYIPGDFVVARHSIFNLLEQPVMQAAFMPVFVVTGSLLGSMVAICLLFKATGISDGTAFAYVLDLTGGCAGSLLYFVLPAHIYRGLVPGGKLQRAADALRRFGWVACVAVAATVVYDVVS